ncbi:MULTISPECIES: hypothetical protein [Arthrobacter]|uniref:hypothetical protein n=1 Tax=Arthrobacter TaxID=1663 RepID=UPI0014048F54|nr:MULTISPECIES: hypothetical protein [Arthrobacter]MBT8159738.1 hypothetical protein [Arthrobacter sp. GN70]
MTTFGILGVDQSDVVVLSVLPEQAEEVLGQPTASLPGTPAGTLPRPSASWRKK